MAIGTRLDVCVAVAREPVREGRREHFPATTCNLSRDLRGPRVPRSLDVLCPLGAWRPPGSGSPVAPRLRPDPLAPACGGRLRGGDCALCNRRAVPVRARRPLSAPPGDGHL